MCCSGQAKIQVVFRKKEFADFATASTNGPDGLMIIAMTMEERNQPLPLSGLQENFPLIRVRVVVRRKAYCTI